jgi:hypothetical protein
MTLQPDPDPQHRTLVEREGVNAGSDRSTVEGDREEVSPPVASQPSMSEHDDTAARRGAVGGGGPPRELDGTGDLPAPDTDAVESGQDNGSMS